MQVWGAERGVKRMKISEGLDEFGPTIKSLNESTEDRMKQLKQCLVRAREMRKDAHGGA